MRARSTLDWSQSKIFLVIFCSRSDAARYVKLSFVDYVTAQGSTIFSLTVLICLSVCLFCRVANKHVYKI